MNEDRSQIWYDYIKTGGLDHRIMKRMFTEYSRYYEANLLLKYFTDNKIKVKTVIDFGAGAGDYGMTFARAGSKVIFYDYPRSTEFIQYRIDRENLDAEAWSADEHEEPPNVADLVIFGEVLEHLIDPYNTLKQFKDCKFIFTSSYPYRSDDPDDPYWSSPDHHPEARLVQPACRKFLEDNYNFEKFEGELRLWAKK